MWAIALHDLKFRSRQFLIAVFGAGLTFAMALLLTGLAESFRNEVKQTVGGFGADAWVVPEGITGPFTAFSALTQEEVRPVATDPGVTKASPLVMVPQTAAIDGEVQGLRFIGYALGGLGAPPDLTEGRAVGQDGEAVADDRLGADVGDRFTVAGQRFTVVGLVHGMTLLGGTPNVYITLADARDVAFRGQPLVSAMITKGMPTDLPAGLVALDNDDVRADTIHAMRSAIGSIDNSRALMWIVAAIIVAALMYVSALERLRDFAVLKSLGSSSVLLFAGVALQAIIVALLAAGVAVAVSNFMKPMFELPVEVPDIAFLALPVVAVAVGLLSSLVALRRAVSVDPAQAFAGAT